MADTVVITTQLAYAKAYIIIIIIINDPAARLQLRHITNPEPVSALQAACLLFVGVQLLLPGQESGFDFQREFELARGLLEKI